MFGRPWNTFNMSLNDWIIIIIFNPDMIQIIVQFFHICSKFWARIFHYSWRVIVYVSYSFSVSNKFKSWGLDCQFEFITKIYLTQFECGQYVLTMYHVRRSLELALRTKDVVALLNVQLLLFCIVLCDLAVSDISNTS